MTTRYFNVKQGITTGNITIDATTGNITGIGNISVLGGGLSNLGNLATANFTIEGMTCAVGCAKTIESKLIETEGVQEAVVDFESKIATVSYDKTKLNITSLTATIEKVAGGDAYKVSKAEAQVIKK